MTSSAPPLPPRAADVLAGRKAEFWERTDYDRAFRGTFGAYMTDVEARALDRVFPVAPVARLLDLGCGHGRFLRWLTPRARHLVGLDRSRRLLEIARHATLVDPPAVPTAFAWGSADTLPFAGGVMDVVTCVRVIQHVPCQDEALAEAARVLRAGGHLVLVQYNLLSPHGLIRALKLPLKALARFVLRAIGREPKFDEPTRWTHWRALERQVERCGLQVERVTGAWLFPLQYFRSRKTNDAWRPMLRLALALEKLADKRGWRCLGGYLVVRCRKP